MNFAQFASSERAIHKNLQKGHYEKARMQLKKTLKKDSLNAAASYLFAQYYFLPDNPAFNIDSAYHHVQVSLRVLSKTFGKRRDRLKRFAIDSMKLISLRNRIDSAAFEHAKRINTEGAFLHFLSGFPSATQYQEAIILRNEAAYQDAVRANTYESFLHFLEKYPTAVHAGEARNRYERLVYETKTRSRTLASYESFLSSYPATPYRHEVERHIFEIFTATGSPESFLSFLQRYPQSSSSKQARDILFHLLEERYEFSGYESLLNDSLRNIKSLNIGYLVPVLKDGLFGLMNILGKLIIPNRYVSLPEDYRCGNIKDDVLILGGKLTSRDGTVIDPDTVLEVEDIGYGFLQSKNDNCTQIIHKSGFSVGDCVVEGKVVAGRYLALKKNDHWALHSLAGQGLTPYDWDEINAYKDILIFKKDSKYWLTNTTTVWLAADQQKISFSGPYDDLKQWAKDLLWVASEEKQGVLNQNLQEVIKSEPHTLKQTFFGAIALSSSGVDVYRWTAGIMSPQHFKNVTFKEPWIAVQRDKGWSILNGQHTDNEAEYDTIVFTGPFAQGCQEDFVEVYFSDQNRYKFQRPVQTVFLPGLDTAAFLIVIQDNRKTVYNQHGSKLLSTGYDDIQHAGQNFFIISQKGKKGLINAEGKLLLPIEFDGIGSISNNVISLLKNKKFGVYHVISKKLIKPEYEKNLVIYNAGAITAFQKGLYGFISWDNKPISQFEFTEIQHWNDTVALVSKNKTSMLYDVLTGKIRESPFLYVKFIKNTADEKLAIVKQEQGTGVIGTNGAFIIAPTFSHIVNVGSADEPLFLTEKHVEEASIFVVIYYDKEGNLLHRYVYEEEDYEKIYCSDN